MVCIGGRIIVEFPEDIGFTSCILPGGGSLASHVGGDAAFQAAMIEIIKAVWEDEAFAGWIADYGLKGVTFGFASNCVSNYNSTMQISGLSNGSSAFGELASAAAGFSPEALGAADAYNNMGGLWDVVMAYQNGFIGKRGNDVCRDFFSESQIDHMNFAAVHGVTEEENLEVRVFRVFIDTALAEVGAAVCFDINTYGFHELSPRIAVKGGRIAPTAHGG